MNYTMSTVTPPSVSNRRTKPDATPRDAASVSKTQPSADLKPKFAEFTCSHKEVYLFVCAVTNEIIPGALWGCKKNRKIVYGRECLPPFLGLTVDVASTSRRVPTDLRPTE